MTEEVPSEKVQAKAAEYLLSGAVKVQALSETEYFLAHVTPKQGGDPYFVKFNPMGWHCDCPARTQGCSHILACQTITDLGAPTGPPKFTHDQSIDDLLNG